MNVLVRGLAALAACAALAARGDDGKAASGPLAGARGAGEDRRAAERPFPSLSAPRAVTRGPHDHLLANYFAINAWSADFRYLAVLETDVNGRLPRAGERCTVGLVDTQDGNRFVPVTTTACWNFQEAAMLHWLPNEPDTFVFNDVRDGAFVAVVMNWRTKAERVVPCPVSAVSRDGRWAVSVNYARLHLTRPDYGYAGEGQDARAATTWPEDDGLWLVDLATGEAKLILSVAQGRARMPPPKAVPGRPGNPLAYYCHTVFNPSATRIFFLARTVDWFEKETHKIPQWLTTSFTVRTDGTDLRRCFADDTAGGSHFNWLDDENMVVTTWPTGASGRKSGRHMKFRVGEEEKGRPMAPGLLDWDGHCVYSPNGRWMSTEGYYDFNFNRQWAIMRTSDERIVRYFRDRYKDDRPILVSESGVKADYGVHDPRGRAQYTEDFQAEYTRIMLEEIFANTNLAGVAIWQCSDCRTYTRTKGLRNRAYGVNTGGLFDLYRRPKMAVEAVRRCFQALPCGAGCGFGIMPEKCDSLCRERCAEGD